MFDIKWSGAGRCPGDPIPGDPIPGDPITVAVPAAVRCAELVATARAALGELAGLVSDGVFAQVPDVVVGEYVVLVSPMVRDMCPQRPGYVIRRVLMPERVVIRFVLLGCYRIRIRRLVQHG